MPNWKVLDKQTRERLGEVTEDTQSLALKRAALEYGENGARYVEVSLWDRPAEYRPPGFTLSQAEVELALLTWARAFKNIPEGYQVRVQVLAHLTKPAMLAEVYDSVRRPRLHEESCPSYLDNQVEGFAPGEVPEGR